MTKFFNKFKKPFFGKNCQKWHEYFEINIFGAKQYGNMRGTSQFFGQWEDISQNLTIYVQGTQRNRYKLTDSQEDITKDIQKGRKTIRMTTGKDTGLSTEGFKI